jgi:hypothetical protein
MLLNEIKRYHSLVVMLNAVNVKTITSILLEFLADARTVELYPDFPSRPPHSLFAMYCQMVEQDGKNEHNQMNKKVSVC